MNGRVLNWCSFFKKKEKSVEDKMILDGKLLFGILYPEQDRFIELYLELGSMNLALKAMGYPGAISHWYKSARKILDVYNISPNKSFSTGWKTDNSNIIS